VTVASAPARIPSSTRADALTLSAAAVGALLIWSAVPMVLLVYHTLAHGGVVSGADGPVPGADQLYYMDSIRQSGEHLLIGDRFDLSIGHDVFIEPLFLVGGLLWRAGLGLVASFWSLSLIAAPVLALGSVAVARRALVAGRERAVAVALGLFYMTPVVPLLASTGAARPLTRYELLLPAAESMPAWQLWGYPASALAIGSLCIALMGIVALASRTGPRGNGRLIAGVSAAACLTSWLHPWQGATFILVTAVLLLAPGQALRRSAALAVPALAAALPLAYEAILSHADRAWHIDSLQNSVGHDPVWMLLVALLPLALPALWGARAIAAGPLRTVLVAWPVVGVAVYFGSSQFAYHALQGISIPLAVLAVAGWRGLTESARAVGRHGSSPQPLGRGPTRALLATAAVALLTVTAAAYELKSFRDSERSNAAPYWFTPGERAALAYLDGDRTPGGVLARDYLGMAVPAFTGRRTWVGEWTWTPDYSHRLALAEQLMRGQDSPAAARRLVTAIGARFVLTDCMAPAPLGKLLGSLVARRQSFDCAAVYELGLPRAVR
jgi:hypothetical protein